MSIGAIWEERSRQGETACAKALRQERCGMFEELKLLEWIQLVGDPGEWGDGATEAGGVSNASLRGWDLS